jgi:hypothetical protein
MILKKDKINKKQQLYKFLLNLQAKNHAKLEVVTTKKYLKIN